MFSLIKREFCAYFISPMAYVTLFFFLLFTGFLFSRVLDLLTVPGTKGIEFPMQGMYGDLYFWLFFPFIPPLLTMRLFAEERNTGTIETLMTAPIRDWQIVAAKFIACFLFYLVLLLPTLAYLPILLGFDRHAMIFRIDPWTAVTTYAGLVTAGAMFISLGMLVSSLVKSQILAALVTFSIANLFIAPAFYTPGSDPSSLIYTFFKYVTVPQHFFNDFTRGIIDTRHLVLYITVSLFCLFLTVRSLEARRLG